MSKVKLVLKIALPAVGEMLLYMLVWVIDTAFVGHYGGNSAVSAVGFSSEIVYTTANIFIGMGLGVGITTAVAQNIGANQRERAEKFLSQGIIVGLVIALIISISIGIFPSQILKFAGAKDEVLVLGSKFMRIVAIAAFFNMVNSILNAGLRGTGNTVTPLVVSGVINVITIFLDWTLIFGRFGVKPLGVVGAAIATSAAYFTGFIFLVIYYRYYSDFKVRVEYLANINLEYIKKILRLAIPAGLQEGAFSISRIVSLMFIMHLGTVAFATNQITTTIESVSFMPGWGFAVAATALVGQRIGAKDFKNARRYAWISMFFGVGLMLLCGVLFLVIPGHLFSLFIDNKETIGLGKMCLMIAAIEQPFMAIGMVMGGALKGSGNTRLPFYVSLITNWCIRLPLIYFVIYIAKLPVYFVWAVMAIQWSIEGTTILIAFKKVSSKWESKIQAV